MSDEPAVRERPSGAVPPPGAPASRMARPLIALFAVSVGLSVANTYYIQPLLPLLGHDFHVSAGVAALATTLGQLGYAAGIVLLLPLGDLLDRRRLVVTLSLACAAALVLAASAPAIGLLLGAFVLVGASAVVAQLLVPFAASLAAEHERGRVVGMVMSGLLIGILLARTVAAEIAAVSSWRVVLYFAAATMAVVALVQRVRLPADPPRRSELSYGQLLASLFEILRSEPALRRRAAYGAVAMGCFSALWTSIAFLLAGPAYHLGTAGIGLFSLVGAAGAVMASVAGRLADSGRTPQVTLVGAFCLTVSGVPLYLGAHSMGALVLGVVLLDIGVQCLHITNQHTIYRLDPARRSRVNAVYMVAFFFGAAAASALSAAIYAASGWGGIAVLCGALGALALVAALIGFARRPRA